MGVQVSIASRHVAVGVVCVSIRANGHHRMLLGGVVDVATDTRLARDIAKTYRLGYPSNSRSIA